MSQIAGHSGDPPSPISGAKIFILKVVRHEASRQIPLVIGVTGKFLSINNLWAIPGEDMLCARQKWRLPLPLFGRHPVQVFVP